MTMDTVKLTDFSINIGKTLIEKKKTQLGKSWRFLQLIDLP
jgi:hypothetical protein